MPYIPMAEAKGFTTWCHKELTKINSLLVLYHKEALNKIKNFNLKLSLIVKISLFKIDSKAFYKYFI